VNQLRKSKNESIILHRQPMLKRLKQNTTRLYPVLFRLFALKLFQGVERKSHMVTRLSFRENGSRLGCLPVFTR
jgi:hypothetical protein